ncbi:hypothetical protein [Chryseobacterium hagamense]|uniref:Uncharacterized protein n=1 Tax=Chryseobacterium hagamense TaxID=395935 RepID=A0A511YNR2_9FLAO|nr:hypothetical protein [Chryseobacterium hagamense]GEN76827.1 hypothetical protein CHA01nite_25670 [Chryseobacterium hagamense]
MNKTLLEITQTKNIGLSEVLVNWKNYDQATVLLSVAELKKRNVPINGQMESLISGFSENAGKPFKQLEKEFFEMKGVKDYTEYAAANTQVLEKSDEERLYLEQLRKLRMAQIQQQNQKQAKNDLLYGGLWFAGGLIVTIISLSNGHGGIIAYGAVIFGGIQFFRGLSKS